MMRNISDTLIFMGLIIVVFGLFLKFMPAIPGDIIVKRKNFTFYFPIMTCIALSIILSLIFYILNWLRR